MSTTNTKNHHKTIQQEKICCTTFFNVEYLLCSLYYNTLSNCDNWLLDGYYDKYMRKVEIGYYVPGYILYHNP